MKYDLIVIGAGSAGLTSAEYGAKVGAKVLMIEKEKRLGGECLHTGCVPSKALIHAAEVGMDFPKALKAVQASIKNIEDRSDNIPHLEALGIDVVTGEATFTDKKSVEVKGKTYTGKKIVIATGSSARPLPGEGNDKYLTNETFFTTRKLPKKLLILGAGPIGLEMAAAMARFGSKVTLIESGPALLSMFSKPVRERFETLFAHKNINLLTNSRLTSYKNGKASVEMPDGAKKTIQTDELLVSIGRVPNMPKGLEAAGISYEAKGIDVNSVFRTTNRNIYAAGDVSQRLKFTHTAGEAGAVATTHALFGVKQPNHISTTPFAIFSTPEIAGVGETGDAVADKPGVDVFSVDYAEIDKAVTGGQQGIIRVYVGAKGRIVGAEIVGANSSELIGYFSLAIAKKLSLQDFSKAIFPYPTLTMALKKLGSQAVFQQSQKYNGALNVVRKLRR